MCAIQITLPPGLLLSPKFRILEHNGKTLAIKHLLVSDSSE